MTREDVISWLEYLSDDARSKADGLIPTNIEIACGMAIDALNAQEPLPPIIMNGRRFQIKKCPKCYMTIKADEKPNFCSNCGQAVKWE